MEDLKTSANETCRVSHTRSRHRRSANSYGLKTENQLRYTNQSSRNANKSAGTELFAKTVRARDAQQYCTFQTAICDLGLVGQNGETYATKYSMQEVRAPFVELLAIRAKATTARNYVQGAFTQPEVSSSWRSSNDFVFVH